MSESNDANSYRDSAVPLLEERDERLLSRYFDGEASWLDQLRARRLLARSSEARTFIQSLEMIRDLAANLVKAAPAEVQLWEKISRRIDAEERAAVFLGGRYGRASAGSTDSILGRLTERLSWSAMGGVAAAAVTMLVVAPLGGPQNSGQQQLAMLGQPVRLEKPGSMLSTALEEVRFSPSDPTGIDDRTAVVEQFAPNTEPVILSRPSYPRAMEVEWMRSDGRVRMLQAPKERSAIIWVKRREPNSGGIVVRRSVPRAEPLYERYSPPIGLEAGSSR